MAVSARVELPPNDAAASCEVMLYCVPGGPLADHVPVGVAHPPADLVTAHAMPENELCLKMLGA